MIILALYIQFVSLLLRYQQLALMCSLSPAQLCFLDLDSLHFAVYDLCEQAGPSMGHAFLAWQMLAVQGMDLCRCKARSAGLARVGGGCGHDWPALESPLSGTGALGWLSQLGGAAVS